MNFKLDMIKVNSLGIYKLNPKSYEHHLNDIELSEITWMNF
jgi:hypothetical protein